MDFALLLPELPEAFIRRLKPDFVVKGKEYESRDNPEQDAVASYGGALLFSSGEVRFSSLDLLHREYFETNYSPVVKPRDYPERHSFQVTDLVSVLARFAGLRVLVIGNMILDEYVSCDPIGMSQEDPTIVVTPIESKMFLGGAGIVAAHASGIGANVSSSPSLARMIAPASHARAAEARYRDPRAWRRDTSDQPEAALPRPGQDAAARQPSAPARDRRQRWRRGWWRR